MPPPDVLVPLLAIILLAGATQGVAGFGFGMLAMGLSPLVLPFQESVPVVAVLAMGSRIIVLLGWRRHVEWYRLRPLLIGAVLGVPLGIYALVHLERRWVLASLGLVIVSFALRGLRAEFGARRAVETETLDRGDDPQGRKWGYLAGVLGGALGGGFNVGGPPAVIYVSSRRWAQGGVKATLQTYFITISTVQIALLLYEGLLTPELLLVDALLVPALVLGTVAGHRVARRVPNEVFRRVLLFVLLALGLNFVVRAALTLLS